MIKSCIMMIQNEMQFQCIFFFFFGFHSEIATKRATETET